MAFNVTVKWSHSSRTDATWRAALDLSPLLSPPLIRVVRVLKDESVSPDYLLRLFLELEANM